MISVSDIGYLIGRYLPEPHAGLLAGMLVGTKQTIPTDLYDALITSGTLHIVALSGTNITILAQLVMQSLLLFCNRRIAALSASGIIIGFVWFVGPSASVVRAAIMGCISLLAVVTGHRTWGWWSWLVTCLLMLVFAPGLIGDISFQLSAAASLGLVLFAGSAPQQTGGVPSAPTAAELALDLPDPGVPGRGRVVAGILVRHIVRIGTGVATADLMTTLAAQVFTLPIIFLTFRRLSLVSPLSNILIGWVLTPLTAAGITLVAAAFVIPPLATVISWFLWVGLTYVVWVIKVTAALPFAGLAW